MASPDARHPKQWYTPFWALTLNDGVFSVERAQPDPARTLLFERPCSPMRATMSVAARTWATSSVRDGHGSGRYRERTPRTAARPLPAPGRLLGRWPPRCLRRRCPRVPEPGRRLGRRLRIVRVFLRCRLRPVVAGRFLGRRLGGPRPSWAPAAPGRCLLAGPLAGRSSWRAVLVAAVFVWAPSCAGGARRACLGAGRRCGRVDGLGGR